MPHGYSLRWLYFALLSTLFWFALDSQPLRAQAIIVNEVYNSSLTTDEWVELLVVQDSLDIRNWTLHDFTSTGASSNTLTFASTSLWSALRKGTIIVVGQSGFVTTEDTDPSDRLLIIKGTNATYFSGTPFLFSGSSDAIQIRDPSTTHIFGVSWGTNNASSLPAPKVHFSGSSTSNTSMAFQQNDTTLLTSTSNWLQNTIATQGLGNSTNNSAWINSLRAHADGSGFAIVKPDTMKHGLTYSMTITYHRDTAFTVTDMRIIMPSNFAWSHSTSDVSSTNIT
ncbi:MAG: lamin tail domain-containing protein, partial [Ignavibacteria bacterium]